VVFGDEPGDHRDRAAEPVGQRARSTSALVDVDLAPGVGDDGPPVATGLEELGVDPAGGERGLEHPDGGALAHADDLRAVGVAGLVVDVVEQFIGRIAHRAGDGDDLVTGLDGGRDRIGRPRDAFAVAETRPAELHYDPHRIT
jgi:hypothetical protein